MMAEVTNSSTTGLPWIVAKAPIRTTRDTRWGWSTISRCETMAPIEWPTTTARSRPMASMNARTSSEKSL